jgi:hypothetical protein
LTLPLLPPPPPLLLPLPLPLLLLLTFILALSHVLTLATDTCSFVALVLAVSELWTPAALVSVFPHYPSPSAPVSFFAVFWHSLP